MLGLCFGFFSRVGGGGYVLYLGDVENRYRIVEKRDIGV